MKHLFLAISCLLLFHGVYGQKENNNWVVGVNAKVDFNTPVPTVSNGQMMIEGSSTMSNRHSGAIMFYSNGIKVWDANDNVMPNGGGLIGGTTSGQNSTTQGALIVPFIDDTTKFYLFTLQGQDFPNETPGALHYSVVDMTLNGGLGDVVAGQKNIFVQDSLCEAMVAVKGAGCMVWVLTHERVKNVYKAFEVTNLGVNTTPVISALPDIFYFPQFTQAGAPFNFSNIKSAPDGSKICMSSQGYGILSDFDNSTGVVNNQITLDSNEIGNNSHVFWSCFSPGSNILYLSLGGTGHSVLQYDVSSGNSTAILASKTVVDTGAWEDLQIVGNKIYVAQISPVPGLGKITTPDVPGIGCNFDPTVLSLNGGIIPATSQNLIIYANADTQYTSKDTNICASSFPLSGRNGALGYNWNTGAVTQTITANGPGIYWVISQMACNAIIDSFEIINDPDTLTFIKDTSVCNGQAIFLKGRSNADTWLWNTGDGGQQQTISTQGTYWVYSVLGCNVYLDSFIVDTSGFTFSLGNDTSLCNGSAVTISPNTNADNYLWQDGSTGSTYHVTTAGIYILTAAKNSCTDKDTIVVSEQTFNISQTDKTICKGTPLTINASVPGATYLWQDGSTEGIYTITDSGQYVVQVSIGNCSDTAGFYVQYFPSWQDSILGGKTNICNGEKLAIKALQLPGYTYVWQDSTYGPAIVADKEGWYIVTMMHNCGVQKDSVYISQSLCDCKNFFPSAFTPNNDGHNDKIGAHIDCDTRNFELAIYNRWGNRVYFTNNQYDKWDGIYENEPCDMSTYYYYYKFESPRGEEFFVKGSIQLLR